MAGKLLIVGTPIGNLSDFSPRAVEALKSADVILCEDTRHTRKLLTHFEIATPTESYHEHNEDEKAPRLLERLESGQTLALVSDAGMPVVSDPGYRIVRLARDAGIAIEPVPGPFAGILALVSSGLAPLPFTFLGFTPHREGQRRDFYRRAAELGHTVVVYESPERVIRSLHDARESFGGEAEATVARELTKLHEEIVSGTLDSLIEAFDARDSIKGEITIVIGARAVRAPEVSDDELAEEFQRLRDTGMRRNDAIKAVAEKFGMRKNEVYARMINRA
jgi:16S rRNA (cytidine1402-2'-O)-methyltransferase